ncbi:sigma-70 family RNA polymerase sigma factor [Christiangramia fulva]|uniref:Sigma-70 family RNA polymerase sigma factor n=1 Tax=Christiangramia fulva TaxID=2126553 RepID=A0A2R3Z3A8_9FLAO|nr:sigma-70 family RNA polymerase sigma factor [Christiangramia fulva]AVR44753.1 sigma-70 family RNA polymerase sigma factor [Christiangramia fulva]
MTAKQNLLQISDLELLQLIKKDPDYISVVYKKTRDYSLRLLYKMSAGSDVRQEELQEIYQEAVIVLYEKIIHEDFELINNSSIQTYLNSVCRYKLLDLFKKSGKRSTIEEGSLIEDLKVDPSVDDELREIEIQDEVQHKVLKKCLLKMEKAGGHCYEILVLFWYHSKSIRELTEHFGYTNEANTKVQKSKCQKRLKKMAFKELND